MCCMQNKINNISKASKSKRKKRINAIFLSHAKNEFLFYDEMLLILEISQNDRIWSIPIDSIP